MSQARSTEPTTTIEPCTEEITAMHTTTVPTSTKTGF